MKAVTTTLSVPFANEIFLVTKEEKNKSEALNALNGYMKTGLHCQSKNNPRISRSKRRSDIVYFVRVQ